MWPAPTLFALPSKGEKSTSVAATLQLVNGFWQHLTVYLSEADLLSCQAEFVSEERLAALYFDDLGMRLEDGHEFFGGWHLHVPENSGE